MSATANMGLKISSKKLPPAFETLFKTQNNHNLPQNSTHQSQNFPDDEYMIPQKGLSLEQITQDTFQKYSQFLSSSSRHNLKGLGDKCYIDDVCRFGDLFHSFYGNPSFNWDSSGAHADSMVLLSEKIRRIYSIPEKFSYGSKGVGFLAQSLNDAFFLCLNDAIGVKVDSLKESQDNLLGKFSVYGVPNQFQLKPLKIKDIHNYHYEYFTNPEKNLELNFDELKLAIDQDIQDQKVPLLMIYTIRDIQTSLQEIERVEKFCLENKLTLFINGDDTGMFGHSNSLFQKITSASYVSIGFTKISGMTSLMLYVEDRDRFKKNLVDIGREYYKPQTVKCLLDKDEASNMLTINQFVLKDYIIGFGTVTSLMKLLFYFEAKGASGFIENLKLQKSRSEILEKEILLNGNYENLVRFENFLICDRKGYDGDNQKFYDEISEKRGKDLEELFSLYKVGSGQLKLLFVASSSADNWDQEFVKKNLQTIDTFAIKTQI